MRRARRLPLEQLAPYLFEEDRRGQFRDASRAEPIDWQSLFGNNHPVEIEIGFGKGLFLLNAAMQRPEINFFGIEIMRKYQLFTATRMAVRQRTNVKLACGDARLMMCDRVRPQSVRAIHVYFPDPWWKKRHHKRRVFTPDFVASCVQALQPGGRLHLATDVADYFTVMTESCQARPEWRAVPTAEFQFMAGDYLTNFERKAKLKAQPVYRAAYQKLRVAP